jgi:hypothetical protein
VHTIRLDSAVEGDLDDARRKWERVDDAWNTIEWALARDPTIGTPLSESGLARSLVVDGSWAHDMPTIQIVYIFEEPYVTIKSVRFSDPAHSAGNA